MPLFLNSGALQSRGVISGDLVSGDIRVGHVGSGALTSGTIANGTVLSGHLASGIGGANLTCYYKQIGANYPLSATNLITGSGEQFRCYFGGEDSRSLGTASFNAIETMRVYCLPFAINRSGQSSRIAIWQTQSANDGRLCQMGLYECGADLWPTNLLYSTNQLRMSGSSWQTGESVAWAFAPNKLYWLAYVQGSGGVIGMRGTNYPFKIFSLDAALSPTNINMLTYRQSGGTWPLPNPFPSSSGWSPAGIEASLPVPAIAVFF